MRTKKKRKKTGISFRLLTCLFLALDFGRSGWVAAQTGGDSGHAATRTIQGKVLTSEGAEVPGAVVLLKDNKTLQVRSYIAQPDGGFHFFGLSTEVNYTLRAESHDLTSKQKTVSVFDSHRNVELNLKLTQKLTKPNKK